MGFVFHLNEFLIAQIGYEKLILGELQQSIHTCTGLLFLLSLMSDVILRKCHEFLQAHVKGLLQI